jgi:sugar-phosphatase
MVLTLECAAVLFDLDGVLVDSLGVTERILREWAASHGVDGDHAVELSHGRRDVDLVALLAPQLDAQAEAAWIVGREERAVAGITAMPGASDLLGALPPQQWAVVTSGVRTVARGRIAAAGLPEPVRLVAAEDVDRGKPDPQPYLRGADLLGVAPERCVVVEDAMSGVRAAAAAGMACVGVGAQVEPSGVTAHVASLQELDVIVDRGLIRISASVRSTRRSDVPREDWG